MADLVVKEMVWLKHRAGSIATSTNQVRPLKPRNDIDVVVKGTASLDQEDKVKESTDNEVEWTDKNEQTLKLLLQLNLGPIRVNPDELDALLKKKANAIFKNDLNINSPEAGTLSMKIAYEPVNGTSHLVFDYNADATGQDLIDAFELACREGFLSPQIHGDCFGGWCPLKCSKKFAQISG